MTKKNFINIILTGIAMVFCSCGNKESGNSDSINDISKAFLENIETVQVVMDHQEKEVFLTGKVEYNPDNIISYVPLISGVIDKAHFSLGDKVQKGQALLDVRSTELSALQAERIALEAEEKTAEREMKTAQSMFEDNLLSESELLEAAGKLKQIQAAINKIKSDMHVYGTDRENGVFTVHAPMSGYIVYKKAAQGSTVSADSEAVFTIADLSNVWVTANVYAGDLLFVREGIDVEMTTFSYPDEVFYGRINSLSQVFDPEERVLKARIIMDNSDLKLKPEMSMLVKLKDKTSRQYATVPLDALIFDDDRYFTVVEEAAGNFVIRAIVPQGHNNNVSYITDGLSEGEKVVVRNQLLIYSGLMEGQK